jgi:hypothetical protein
MPEERVWFPDLEGEGGRLPNAEGGLDFSQKSVQAKVEERDGGGGEVRCDC